MRGPANNSSCKAYTREAPQEALFTSVYALLPLLVQDSTSSCTVLLPRYCIAFHAGQ